MFKRVGPAETDVNKAVWAVGIILYVALFSDVSTQFFSGGRRERIRWERRFKYWTGERRSRLLLNSMKN